MKHTVRKGPFYIQTYDIGHRVLTFIENVTFEEIANKPVYKSGHINTGRKQKHDRM